MTGRSQRRLKSARATGSGRLLEITNGYFVDAKREEAEAERRAALEKPDGRLRVDSTPPRPSAPAAREY